MRSKFEKLIKDKIVITKYNLKCYKIMNVAWDLRPTTNFLTRGQQEVSQFFYQVLCSFKAYLLSVIRS